MPLFEFQDLEKTYYGEEVDTQVLKGITFSIEKGEFVSVMGPSGSGKSTLLHIMGFLDGHTGGKYLFNGKSFTDLSDEEVAFIRNDEMGFVFQQFNLLSRQTVYENVKLPLMYSKKPEREWHDRIEEVIDLVGLSHRSNFEASRLSGGEKQRVAIARALVNNPDVIFADEPTGNLDSESGRVVMEKLQELHDDLGHTVILITHETFTAKHAERLLYLKDGVIQSDDPITDRKFAKEIFSK